jgi:hypothetical protein
VKLANANRKNKSPKRLGFELRNNMVITFSDYCG